MYVFWIIAAVKEVHAPRKGMRQVSQDDSSTDCTGGSLTEQSVEPAHALDSNAARHRIGPFADARTARSSEQENTGRAHGHHQRGSNQISAEKKHTLKSQSDFHQKYNEGDERPTASWGACTRVLRFATSMTNAHAICGSSLQGTNCFTFFWSRVLIGRQTRSDAGA